VPLALSEALRSGKLGVMDYYNLQNISADTQMRQAFGATGSKQKSDLPDQDQE
jgi:uncharacterized protein YqfA (UPF0365 family)